MQLQRIELKKLGTTERILRSDTQGNFDKLENAVNSNAGATEAWYKQLSSNLADEAQTRAEADKELNSKIDKLNSNKVGNTDFDAKLSEFNEDWKNRLRRVTLGTDKETIENIVTKILIEKGVI